MKKKSLSLLLAVSMLVSSFGTPVLAAKETANLAESETVEVSVYPKPQSIKADESQGMLLKGTVDIVVHGEQETATLPKLEELLQNEGIDYNLCDETGENAAIVLAVSCGEEDCSICQSVEDAENALSHTQGYVLQSESKKHENGQITIIGADADGVYYGLMSLRQMFEQKTADGKIAAVTISDYPDIPYRGYVEGFYGMPWSHEDRIGLFEDTSLYKMTTYIYAPKDDPYHRSSWRTLYPESEQEKIRELAAAANANNMDFCWTIHPGEDYNYTKDADGNGIVDDYEKLIAKFDQVYDLGVRQFGIFYDDISYEAANGTQHAQVINSAYEYLKAKSADVKPFITVVTRYNNTWGADWNSYLKPFMQNVHEDTLVLWTGNDTMSGITKEFMEYPQTKIGVDRDFGVWWNYPVYDWGDAHLLMSPLACVDTDVDNITSFFLNPLSQAEASKVAIYSGGDYTWNMEAFDYQESWSRAIEELVPDVKEAFERFASNIGYAEDKADGFFFDESVEFQPLLADFDAQDPACVASLKEKFAQMIADANALSLMENKVMLNDVAQHLAAYEWLGKCGAAAMEACEMNMNGDLAAYQKMQEAKRCLEECKSVTVPAMRDSKVVDVWTVVGSKYIIPFLETLLEGEFLVSSRSDEKVITNIGTLRTREVLSDKNMYSLEAITLNMKEGDYVGIALPEVMNIRSVYAKVSMPANVKLQYSLNGIEWYDYAGSRDDGILETQDVVTAAYVRMLCIASAKDMVIETFAAAHAPKEAKISTTLPTYQSYDISYAIDGVLESYFSSSEASDANDYVLIDMGMETNLHQVELYGAVNRLDDVDAFGVMALEVSCDGENFTQVGDVISRTEFEPVTSAIRKVTFDGQGAQARYFRIHATESCVDWVKIHEIKYEADGINNQTVSSDMTVMNSASMADVLDGDMNTAITVGLESGTGILAGNYIQVDLGDLVSLTDANIYFGEHGFEALKVQTSVDGRTWTDVGTEISKDSYVKTANGYSAHAAFDEALTRYVRFAAAKDSESLADIYEITFNQSSYAGSVSTDMSTYKKYVIGNAFDGDMSTRFYAGAGTEVGNYFQIDFGKVNTVFDAAIYFAESSDEFSEGFNDMDVCVSVDGTNWTTVGHLDYTQYLYVDGKRAAVISLDGVSARYFRFVSTEQSWYWPQVYEITFSKAETNTVRFADEQEDAVNVFYPDSAYINQSTIDIRYTNFLCDGDLSTNAVVDAVHTGDALIYPTTTITDVASVQIVQKENAISHAAVSVLELDGTWTKIGTLSEMWNTFDVSRTILAVKMVFDGIVVPEISEISFKEIPKAEPAAFEIVTQPTDASAKQGEAAFVSVEATGEGLTYKWYYKNPGNIKFYDSGTQFVSADGASYTIPMAAWRDGQEVYCIITDANGETLQTNTVTLTIDNGTVEITKQPVDVTADAAGEKVVVDVEATGEGLTYTWYYKNPGNVKFYESGSAFVQDNKYVIDVYNWRDGQQVYCVVTDANGATVQSNTVTIRLAK